MRFLIAGFLFSILFFIAVILTPFDLLENLITRINKSIHTAMYTIIDKIVEYNDALENRERRQ